MEAFALRGREGGAMPEAEGEKVGAIRAANGGSSRSYIFEAVLTAEVAHTLKAKHNSDHRADSETYIPVAYGGNNTRGPIEVATAVRAKGGTGHGDFESETFIAHTLRGNGHDASEDGTGRGVPLVPVGGFYTGSGTQSPSWTDGTAPTVKTSASAHAHGVTSQQGVRRLMPHELERLQGFPDHFTRIPYRGKGAKVCPDGPRAKALGNSMAVPVMAWIGRRLLLVDATPTP